MVKLPCLISECMLRSQAARYHKTSIDALLHPRHHSATPYRVVLGDVSSFASLSGATWRLDAVLLPSLSGKLSKLESALWDLHTQRPDLRDLALRHWYPPIHLSVSLDLRDIPSMLR